MGIAYHTELSLHLRFISLWVRSVLFGILHRNFLMHWATLVLVINMLLILGQHMTCYATEMLWTKFSTDSVFLASCILLKIHCWIIILHYTYTALHIQLDIRCLVYDGNDIFLIKYMVSFSWMLYGLDILVILELGCQFSCYFSHPVEYVDV